jgi:SagB-type dehydrogenase family enzyme
MSERLIEHYVLRRSYRRFESQAVFVEQLGQLLSCLLQVKLEGLPLPKYRYGSAGSLYPVQTYLYIQPDKVEGLESGAYYYHPEAHQLVLLSAGARIDRSVYGPGNWEIFDAAAFAIFLVGQLEAIRPMYGEWAEKFCMLEAGAMTQLLEATAPAYEIGLCQIGGFDFEAVRKWFSLEEGHVYLHGLLGGRINASQMLPQALAEEMGPMRSLLALIEEQPAKEKEGAFSFAPLAAKRRSDEAFIQDLRRFLEKKLPGHMVPSAFVVLEELPLTANGKVDRRALPIPEDLELYREQTFVSPRTPTEKALADICAEILQIEQIGVHDSFFELGGHSVLAVQVVSRVRETLQIELPLRAVFEMPTVAKLAQTIDNMQQGESGDKIKPITFEKFRKERREERL